MLFSLPKRLKYIVIVIVAVIITIRYPKCKFKRKYDLWFEIDTLLMQLSQKHFQQSEIENRKS